VKNRGGCEKTTRSAAGPSYFIFVEGSADPHALYMLELR
jgi:hypothetical protein